MTENEFPKCPCGKQAEMAVMGEDDCVWYCMACIYGDYTISDAPKILNNVWHVDRSNQ